MCMETQKYHKFIDNMERTGQRLKKYYRRYYHMKLAMDRMLASGSIGGGGGIFTNYA